MTDAEAAATLLPPEVTGPPGVVAALREVGYLADRGLATAVFLSLRLSRPLFLEGDAGVGKTSLAAALAEVLGAPLIRLQCYEGIDVHQALYDWNFPKQVLHLRAAEAAAVAGDEAATVADLDALERSVYGEDFLLERPLLRALRTTPSVLLVDEVDRADDEFEAFLLEVLSEWSVTIPELGTVTAEVPPLVVLTSNRTREVHDALKRRCHYAWVDHPEPDREVAIVRTRLPGVGERLAAQVVGVVQAMRGIDLLKPPGVAESLDWARALAALGATELDEALAHDTLGSVLKFREDQERVRTSGLLGASGGEAAS